MLNYEYCRKQLEAITDMVGEMADVRGYDDPKEGVYQIMCLFRYPIGNCLAIDEYYNDVKALLMDWRLTLSVDTARDGTIIAKLLARTKYDARFN